jgi:branched-chain amino acid transport system substrate-binding protein
MKKSLWIIFGIIIIVLIAIFFTYQNSFIKEKEVINIGNIGILTGDAGGASWGNAAKNGVDMAMSDINNNGGINGKYLRVFHEDDSGDPKKTISAFQKLTQVDNIHIIIGTTWSATGIPLVNLADENKVLMISPSLGKPEFNEGSKYLFNTWPHDVTLSASLADYVYNKGHRKVALIGAQELWVKDQTNAFTKRFNELGGSIEVLVEPDPSEREVSTEALKIKNNKDIDAIVSTTDGVLVGSLVAKRTHELGVKLPIYSVTIDSDSIKAANGAYEGMEYLTYLTPTPEFKERYEKEYGTINIGADSGYDAMMLIAKAMNDTKSTDTTVLSDYLSKVKEYDGVSGHLVSDGKRGFTKEFKVMKVENGSGVEIG